MSEINDATVIEGLRRQLAIAAARQAVASSNLANVNTPGYRTREVAFSAALDEHMDGALTPGASLVGRLGAPAGGPTVVEAEGLTPRRDGNNVRLDRELLTMAQAAGEFARAQTALAAKFRLVRYAINEGR